MAQMNENEQRRSGVVHLLRVAGIAFFLLIAVAIIVWVFAHGDGDSKAEAGRVTATATVPPPGVDVNCDKGSGDWELENLHGEGGFVVNGGAPNVLVVFAAAKHDPLILREWYLDLKSASDAKEEGISPTLARLRLDESTPAIDELACVSARMALWNQLTGIASVSTTDTVPMGDLANNNGLAADGNGNYRLPNASVNGNDVGTSTGNIPPGETIIDTKLPNGAHSYHRTYCGNRLELTPAPAPGKGRLEVIKTDDGHNAFGKDLPVPGITIIIDGAEHREGVTDGSGIVWFNDLTPGTYTVREIVPAGWEPVTPAQVTVKIEADRIVLGRFKNRQIEVSSSPTPTRTPGTSSSPSPTATKTPFTPVPPSVTPVLPPSQTPQPRPTRIICCETPAPTNEPDYPFPTVPPTAVRTSDPEPTVFPPAVTATPITLPTRVVPTAVP